MSWRRGRFGDVIARQLDVFVDENGALLRECESALERYNDAERDAAEELYVDFVDLVESGTEALAEMRDAYARTLPDGAGEAYEREFNRAVAKRLPPFALEIENR